MDREAISRGGVVFVEKRRVANGKDLAKHKRE